MTQKAMILWLFKKPKTNWSDYLHHACSRLSDRVSTKSLLGKIDMLSVNQMHAQIKLTEMWKIVHTVDHPIKVKTYKHAAGTAVTRSADTTILLENGKSDLSQKHLLIMQYTFGT